MTPEVEAAKAVIEKSQCYTVGFWDGRLVVDGFLSLEELKAMVLLMEAGYFREDDGGSHG